VEAEPQVKTFNNPREEAAANGVYGSLTREVKMFYPEKLLCKRFGVQNPHPEGDPGKGESGSGSRGGSVVDNAPMPTNDASWTDAFIHKGADVPSAGGSAKEEEEEGERRPKTIGEVGMADDVNQGRDTLSYTKPNIDIFKAIFASDDESDEEEEDEGKAASNGVKLAGPGVVSRSTVGEDPYPSPTWNDRTPFRFFLSFLSFFLSLSLLASSFLTLNTGLNVCKSTGPSSLTG
jgi:G patch domain-containing protein 1